MLVFKAASQYRERLHGNGSVLQDYGSLQCRIICVGFSYSS